jgi:hypothetical protein
MFYLQNKGLPQTLEGILNFATDFNKDNKSDKILQFVLSSKHSKILSTIFPLNTPTTNSNSSDSVRTPAAAH